MTNIMDDEYIISLKSDMVFKTTLWEGRKGGREKNKRNEREKEQEERREGGSKEENKERHKLITLAYPQGPSNLPGSGADSP